MNESIYDEVMSIADKEEQQILDMNYSNITHPIAVDCWFNRQDTDLATSDIPLIEQYYLNEIEEVARRTGAPNFFLADYIWRLEKRLEKIEKSIKPHKISMEKYREIQNFNPPC